MQIFVWLNSGNRKLQRKWVTDAKSLKEIIQIGKESFKMWIGSENNRIIIGNTDQSNKLCTDQFMAILVQDRKNCSHKKIRHNVWSLMIKSYEGGNFFLYSIDER